MIDWVTALIPYHGPHQITGGQVVSIDQDGVIEWSCQKRLSVEGSYSSKIQVRSEPGDFLWISGNPSKFLQGHNLFGSNDLVTLMSVFLSAVSEAMGLDPTPEDVGKWDRGRYRLSRVDVAECFRLPSTQHVDNWLRAASPLVRGKHQGVSAYNGETIYVGQKSRRIALKIYNKARELRKHKLSDDIPCRRRLNEYAEGLLRVEVRLLSLELKKRKLHGARWWSPKACQELIQERIGRLEMPKKLRLTATEISELPPRLVGAVKLWESGADLRAIYPKATFYRYRTELRRFDIDILAPPKTETNVVPLVTYLEAEHQATVPDWAAKAGLLACA